MSEKEEKTLGSKASGAAQELKTIPGHRKSAEFPSAENTRDFPAKMEIEKTKEPQLEVKMGERKSDRKEKNVTGIVYIHSTFNNTIIHVTDMANNTLAQVSGGRITKQSRLKATPTVAMFAAKRAAEIIKELGVTSIYIRIKSSPGSTTSGPGSHAAVKSFDREGLKILNILDTTAIPRGGPKVAGGKRGRRV
ncbi:MAG: 30S ribosomal protein S11 [Nanoarchaeota archaeon]|nr:30S ribosomal protein S11 [Nanoarchaeota archaeon]